MNLATVDREMYVQYRLDDTFLPRNMPPFLEVQLLHRVFTHMYATLLLVQY